MCSRGTARGGLGLSASARMPESPPLYAYVLDADDDLAQELDVRTRSRRASARHGASARCRARRVRPRAVVRAAGHGPGLLILDGLLAVHTRIVDRTVTELVGSGDLLQPMERRTDEMVERATTWRALRPTRFALLDEEFAQRVLPWPQIAHALLRRAERRTRRPRRDAGDLVPAAARGAAVLLFWHLAEPLGPRRDQPASGCRCRSRTACSASSWRRSGRRSRTRSRGWREAGLVTGAPGTGTCTAGSTSTSAR